MAAGSSDRTTAILDFVEYTKLLAGKEKQEAHVFLERLFQAFGHKGHKEAGAELEAVVRNKHSKVNFADLLWKPRCLIEMKSRKAKLHEHYRQAFDYWIYCVPNRPRYVVLCNFDEFWIYDFDRQVHEPVDRVKLTELPQRYTALNFLFPENPKPQFDNDRVAVTDTAAKLVASVFRSLIARKEPRANAQRFVLQSVMSMFAEDIDLLPRGLFTELVTECAEGAASSYDLLGALFTQMNDPKRAKAGRFSRVEHFNGGLFTQPSRVELTRDEARALALACNQNWAAVEPAIFGALFTASMDKEERHEKGAHFTGEAEIQRVIGPTIVRPFQEQIREAAGKSAEALLQLRGRLASFRVLDPACGSGNFLYVAYRELRRLDAEILGILRSDYKKKIGFQLARVSTKQFFGIDILEFGVELAKVTLMLAHELAIVDEKKLHTSAQALLPLEMEASLPLVNLDDNIKQQDALLRPWPEVDCIIGNPPFQSKNKAQQEIGAAEIREVRRRFPDVPGRANYCVYWFRKAHDHLKKGQRAGLVGTNTIRDNYSRIGGLDYIVNNGGTITEAVASQVWPQPDAAVHVSIVNWKKGDDPGMKRLFEQAGDRADSPWRVYEREVINSALSPRIDLTSAIDIAGNKEPKVCHQGQTHGHEEFLIKPDQAAAFGKLDPACRPFLNPYLIGDDLIGTLDRRPTRFVIDFQDLDITEVQARKPLFVVLKKKVLPHRQEEAERERVRNEELQASDPKAKGNKHHANFLKTWWRLSYPRRELIAELTAMTRYIACVRHTKRPIFEFVSSRIRPGDSLQVFTLEDDYSFGILQSDLHWQWFVERCSSIKREWRYTPETVFSTFPWPQNPSPSAVARIAKAAVRVRKTRERLMAKSGSSLRDLYRSLELPGINPLREVNLELDEAVRSAYGFKKGDPLVQLLDLNREVATRERQGKAVTKPGYPGGRAACPAKYVTDDCVE